VGRWETVISGGTRDELVRSVETAVQHGLLRPGEPLPSVRELARESGLSATTVAAAVAELGRRGVIITAARRRSVVAPVPPLTVGLGQRSAEPPAPIGVDLRHGGPDRALLPSPAAALRAVAEENHDPRLYGQPGIDAELRAITAAQLDELGLPGLDERIGVVGGAIDLVERVLLVAVRPGDRVAVEDPGYPDLFDLLRAIGIRAVPTAVDDEGPVPTALRAALDQGISAVVLTPSGQNPFGSRLSPARRDALAEVLSRRPEVLVVEDQHLSLVEPPQCTMAGHVARWAIVRSMAKSLGPDLRVATFAADPDLFARIAGRYALGPGWVSHLLQRTVVRMLRDPAVLRTLEVAGETYRLRREALYDELVARDVTAYGQTGLNLWIPASNEGEAALELARRGWIVSPGGTYRAQSPPGIRVTTSTLDPSEAARLADDITAVLRPRVARRG
jgi:DNA-binding transcriptional MocR family regulator